ncbi:MAG TPA: twin-arginine translocase TatA/TatE family subunit [Pirellulales bacterium]|nr:twin-arginine translocase TatA/TatE family subunit [Pirellulales bacterium]
MLALFGVPLFGIFGVGPVELLVVGGVVLLLFGNRLPSLMRSLGRSMVEFKKGVNEIEHDDTEGGGAAPSGNP